MATPRLCLTGGRDAHRPVPAERTRASCSLLAGLGINTNGLRIDILLWYNSVVPGKGPSLWRRVVMAPWNTKVEYCKSPDRAMPVIRYIPRYMSLMPTAWYTGFHGCFPVDAPHGSFPGLKEDSNQLVPRNHHTNCTTPVGVLELGTIYISPHLRLVAKNSLLLFFFFLFPFFRSCGQPQPDVMFPFPPVRPVPTAARSEYLRQLRSAQGLDAPSPKTAVPEIPKVAKPQSFR